MQKGKNITECCQALDSSGEYLGEIWEKIFPTYLPNTFCAYHVSDRMLGAGDTIISEIVIVSTLKNLMLQEGRFLKNTLQTQ